MRLRAENFSAACEDSDQVCVLVIFCSVSDVGFCWPQPVVGRSLVIGIHHGHLLAVHLHAVAGEDIDDQELLVRAGLDLLR